MDTRFEALSGVGARVAGDGDGDNGDFICYGLKNAPATQWPKECSFTSRRGFSENSLVDGRQRRVSIVTMRQTLGGVVLVQVTHCEPHGSDQE